MTTTTMTTTAKTRVGEELQGQQEAISSNSKAETANIECGVIPVCKSRYAL
jgi:hypothetical protein